MSEESRDLNVADNFLRSYGLIPIRFTKFEIRRGKTPDFRIMNGKDLVAFCEVKSPRDDYLDTQLAAATDREIVGGHRKDPIFNRLAGIIKKAASQFDAVNPGRDVPNILILVNHDDMSNYSDLLETLTGMFHATNGSRYPTMISISEGRIKEKKSRIDIYFWFDFGVQCPQRIVLNRSSKHFNSVCSIFRLDKSKISRRGVSKKLSFLSLSGNL